VALQGRAVRPVPRLLAATVLATLAASSQAQVSGGLGVDSDYRYRGVSLSRSQPSVHASVNYDAPERWYAGASATRAALTPAQTATQLSGYAGWSTTPVDGRSVELGADGSHFAGVSGYDFAEAYAGVLSERWSARLYYAPDYYGRRMQTSYVELNAFPPLDRRIRLFAHAGALVPLAGASGDAARVRFDVSAGAGVALGGWDLHAAVFAATRGGPYPAVYDGRRAALVIGAAVSF
jgi:uncharacterized protein (TIGR02001 family)